MPERRAERALRRMVAERAWRLCEYCRCPESFCPDPFCLDHIQPESLGGETIMANLAFACAGCNAYKQDRTSASLPAGQTIRLFNPRKDRWEEHFRWSEDFLFVIGRTPIARATIHVLRLNRPGLVNLRQILRATGNHPPRSAVP